MTYYDVKSGQELSGISMDGNSVLNVSSGGFVYGAQNSSGNTANVSVDSGGYIFSLDLIGGGVVYNSGTIEVGLLSAATSNAGVMSNVTFYLTADNQSGGRVIDCVVDGTTLNAYSGSVASNLTVYGSGSRFGQVLLSSGAEIYGGSVGGYACVYANGGYVSGLDLSNDGGLQVSSGSIADSTNVYAGGILTVQLGGRVNSATVNSGGTLNAASGAGLSGTLIDNGTISGGTVGYTGDMRVNSGGVLSGTA
ncbi:hypothetical protein ACSW3V_14835, partial [Acetobacter indonesiensis]